MSFQIIAKKSKNGSVHDLINHLIDTYYTSEYILNNIFGSKTKNMYNLLFSQSEIELNLFIRSIAFMASLHDIGKCSYTFQQYIINDTQRPIINHTEMTFLYLYQNNYDSCRTKYFPLNLSNIIGSHHGTWIQRPTQLKNKVLLSEIGIDFIPIYKQYIVELEKIANITTAEISNFYNTYLLQDHFKNGIFLEFVSGMIIFSDWTSSNIQLFPYKSSISFLDYNEQIKLTVKERLDSYFKQYFFDVPFYSKLTEMYSFSSLYPIQFLVSKLVHTKTIRQGIYILEAPMGEGKTEASIFLSNILIKNEHLDGFFYALPTISSSIQLYTRLKDQNPILNLIFGNKFLQTQFQVQDCFLTSQSSKKAILERYGIGTIDQIELSVLWTKHQSLRLLGLMNKVIIIDEVHSYDAFMITILKRLLHYLSYLNSSVILLSATLPTNTKNELIQSFVHTPSSLPSLNEKYPRLSYQFLNDSTQNSESCLYVEKEKNVLIELIDENYSQTNQFKQLLIQQINANANIAIICTTIRDSQVMYEYISEIFASEPIVEISLFNSHFRYKERIGIERKLGNNYGSTKKLGQLQLTRPQKTIFIATQVIEQSLDLDFDIMYSFLAPLNLLLQRLGRVHRHDFYRHPLYKTPKLYVFSPNFFNTEFFTPKYKGIYDFFHIIRTWDYLTHFSTNNQLKIVIPNDMQAMIEYINKNEPSLYTSNQKLVQFYNQIKSDFFQETINYEYLANAELLPNLKNFTLSHINQLVQEQNLQNIDNDNINVQTRLFAKQIKLVLLFENELIEYRSIDHENWDNLAPYIITTQNIKIIDFIEKNNQMCSFHNVLDSGIYNINEWIQKKLENTYLIYFKKNNEIFINNHIIRYMEKTGFNINEIS